MDDSIMILPMITEHEGRPVTTSRIVAEHFGKRHDNVLRDIESLRNALKIEEVTAAFNELNFEPVRYQDEKGESRPMYLLTRDGFTLLAMGFTGQKALQFKVAYIQAFNRMERMLAGGQISAPTDQQRNRQAPSVEGAGIDTTAKAFLSAVTEALRSGEYYIRPEGWRSHKTTPAGKLLGREYGNRVDLFAQEAYRIYAATVDKPTARPALWGMLQALGVIYPRNSKSPKSIKHGGSKTAVITLDAWLLREE